jgi:hypothetical protein
MERLSECKKAFVIILVSDSGQSVSVVLKRPELPSLCLFNNYKPSFTRSILTPVSPTQTDYTTRFELLPLLLHRDCTLI